MAKKVINDSLPVLVQKANLSVEDSTQLLENFKVFEDLAKEWTEKAEEYKVTDISQVDKMAICEEGYKAVKAKIGEVEKLRKELGEPALRKKQAIDAIGSLFKGLLEPLRDQLKEYADYAKNAKANSLKAIAEQRMALLAPYGVSLETDVLSTMLPDVFDNYLRIVKEEYEKEQNRLTAEKEAKEKETERLRKENEELKKALEERPIYAIDEDEHPNLAPSKPIVTVITIAPDADDKAQLSHFINVLNALQYPNLKTPEAIEMFEEVDIALMEANRIITKFLSNEA